MANLAKLFLGIDPGKSGAVAALDETGKSLEVMRFSKYTPKEIFNFLLESAEYHVCYALLEKVHSMPKQGVVSTFKFGESFGLIQGLLLGAGVPTKLITPRAWQKELAIPVRRNETKTQFKRRLREIAEQLWPDHTFTNDQADAALIAECCRLKEEVHVERIM